MITGRLHLLSSSRLSHIRNDSSNCRVVYVPSSVLKTSRVQYHARLSGDQGGCEVKDRGSSNFRSAQKGHIKYLQAEWLGNNSSAFLTVFHSIQTSLSWCFQCTHLLSAYTATVIYVTRLKSHPFITTASRSTGADLGIALTSILSVDVGPSDRWPSPGWAHV